MPPLTDIEARKLRERLADALLVLPELRRVAAGGVLSPDWRPRLLELIARLEEILGRDNESVRGRDTEPDHGA